MDFEVIDFHTHPFYHAGTNICSHKDFCDMTAENTLAYFKSLEVSKICGSVIGDPEHFDQEQSVWEKLTALNDEAIKLHELYGDFYIPGFHVHPEYVKESCELIERLAKNGYKLLGELVPYFHEWNDYSTKSFSEILDVAEQYDMVVSFHSMGEDEMDKMVKEHPRLTLVAAHPGEYDSFMRHMQRMKYSENYYLDLSGYGIFRHGMLRHAIDLFGAERFIYGSDYPTCNAAMYLGGVLLDPTVTDAEKKFIFSENAKRILDSQS